MSERKKVIFLLLLISIVVFVFALLSEGNGYGGGDSIQHFLISKYSFKHPQLLLHNWGKPFFTLISSPFSQLGFIGINIFNILCAFLTCLFAYELAVKWQIKNAWLSVIILLFAPIYFVCIISGLTEIFFAFVLMLSIWLFQRRLFLLSSIIISFLPFIRTEGMLLLPLFALLLIVKKRIIPLAALATGAVLYSVAGWFHFNDFLWLLHQNPYKGAEDIYGHGKLTSFLSQNEFILGTTLVVLLLLGLVSLIFRKEKATDEELILCLGSFVIYFIAHSIFWWKGLFGSDGLIRVLAAVTPMATFTCLHGYNFLLSLFKKSLLWQKGLPFLISFLTILMPFKQHRFPRKMDYEEISIKQAGLWIKDNHLDEHKIYCATPFMWQVLNRDPYDDSQSDDFYALDIQQPEKNIPAGSIIVWDTHFSPNEGRISLQKMSEDSSFGQLNHFETDPRFVPKANGRFEVYLFQKI